MLQIYYIATQTDGVIKQNMAKILLEKNENSDNYIGLYRTL